jgi:hypothetical protein
LELGLVIGLHGDLNRRPSFSSNFGSYCLSLLAPHNVGSSIAAFDTAKSVIGYKWRCNRLILTDSNQMHHDGRISSHSLTMTLSDWS